MKLYPMDIQGRTVSSVSDTNTPRGSGDFSRSELLFCAEEGELHHANLHTHTFPPPLSEKLPLWPLRPSPKRSQNTKVTSAVDSGFSPIRLQREGYLRIFVLALTMGFFPVRTNNGTVVQFTLNINVLWQLVFHSFWALLFSILWRSKVG